MSMRYKGGVISATAPTTSSSSATGSWTLKQQMQAIAGSNWPLVASRSFSISPAVSGKTTWNLDTDGP